MAPAVAGATFALMYGSHMVLQQAPQRANVWGWSGSDQPLALTLSASGKSGTGAAAGTGSPRRVQEINATVEAYNTSMYTWHVQLPPVVGSDTPYTLSIGDSAIDDVLFGDVWVCSGAISSSPFRALSAKQQPAWD